MKKLLVVLLIILLVLGMAACRKSIEESLVEQMIENAAGEGVDVDIDNDGDSISISNDEGGSLEMDSGEGLAWPGDKLPAHVPELTGVTVIQTMDMGMGMSIIFEGCDEDEANAYVQQLENAGWEMKSEMTTTEAYVAYLSMGEDESLNFSWSNEDGTGAITYGKNE